MMAISAETSPKNHRVPRPEARRRACMLAHETSTRSHRGLAAKSTMRRKKERMGKEALTNLSTSCDFCAFCGQKFIIPSSDLRDPSRVTARGRLFLGAGASPRPASCGYPVDRVVSRGGRL
jgi:hypothetical protein